MSVTQPLDPEIVDWVRSALSHLYDYAYLQNHPLSLWLSADQSLDRLTRAQKLRRTLLDCIESLRPQDAAGAPAGAGRAYAILTYRYIDGLSIEEIQDKLAISRRQVYREHAKGIEALARMIQDRLPERRRATPTGDDHDRLRAVQAEIARLQETVSGEPIDLREILREVLHIMASRLREGGIRVEAPGPDWPHVLADRVMLRQALLNLLSCALYAGVAGTIYVETREQEPSLFVTVRGTISGSHKQRADHAKSGEEIGLTVADSLIQAQHGTLQVNKGDDAWEAVIGLPTADRATVLVIDDNPQLVALFQRYLGGHAVSVVGAQNVDSAFRCVRELHPRLIMLDVMMPHHDGWEILQRLSEMPEARGIPIVVCSVLNEPDLAFAMGASDYLVKPVEQEALIKLVRRWLGSLPPNR